MKHTPLYARHMRAASAVINLKGVARAMHYRGHLAEHQATRAGVTLCDVSHMGEFDFRGADALALVQRLITNDAAKLAVNQVLYSALCNAEGNIIDDLVCYRLAADHFVWVVNVTKIDEDYQWVLRHAQGMDVQVKNVSTDTALMALQGPNSREVLQRITRADLSTLRYYWLVQTGICTRHGEIPCLISRTGYTGERGYEIMVARDLAPWIWDELLLVGRPLGIMEHGVAARESLRTEAGYLLNGNDMDAATNPYEAGIGWVVKLDTDFIGRDALARIKALGVSRSMVGLEVEGPLTMRYGCPIFRGGKEVGKVTSGPLSAQIAGRNLGLGYVSAEHAAVGTDDRNRNPREGPQGARGCHALLRTQGQTGTVDQNLVALRVALHRSTPVGARRRRPGHHRPVGFRPARTRRYPQPGSAEAWHYGKQRDVGRLGRRLPPAVRAHCTRHGRGRGGQCRPDRKADAHQCLSVCDPGHPHAAHQDT